MTDAPEDHDMDSPDEHITASPLRRSPRLASRRVSYSPLVQVRRQATRKPGRPKHMIWGYFERVTDGSSKPHAECNYCHTIIRSAQPGTNMQRHLKSCPDAPTAVKQRVIDYFADPQRHTEASALRGPPFATDGAPAVAPTGDATAQPTAAPTPSQQQQFEMALASMFHLCALPFALAESDAFRNPFKLLFPGIRFPSRHRLSGDLLQRARDEIHKRKVALIRQQRFVTVVTDSWTNVNHSTIIDFMVVAPGMPSVFWSSQPTGIASETGEYLAGHLGRVIDEIERETGAVVAGVLTDNASNMSAAWELLERTRPIFGGGCSAHVLNLLIQDVCQLEFFRNIHTKALAITTYVRDHQAVLSQFGVTLRESHTGHRRALVVPVITRWYSLHACFSRVLENRSLLTKLFTEPQFAALIENSASSTAAAEKLTRVKRDVRDIGFWRKLEQVVGFLDPVIEALRELESDNCPTSRVYSRFRWLMNHPAYGTDTRRTDLQVAIERLFEYRWSFVHTDATGLAFLLDPHTDLDDFVGSDEKDTISQGYAFAERSGILERLGLTRADFNRALYGFAGDKRRWSPEKRRRYEGAKPRDWWYLIAKTSLASERAWSIMDFIHSKKRNRLTTDKVDMLAYVYVNHLAVANENADWARLYSYPECHEALEREAQSVPSEQST